MRLSNLDFEFWAVGFLLNVSLLVILWYRRRAKSFPFFTALITSLVVKTIVLYLVMRYGTKADYRHAYWSLTVIDTLLQLSVVYEIASRVFRPLNVWAHDLRHSFMWLASLSVSVAFGLTCLASPPARTWTQSFTTKGNLFAAALSSELFLAMMALSVNGGYPWRTHVASIAQGMGLYSLVGVVIETGHAYFGLEAHTGAFLVLSKARMLAYLGCVFFWIATLSRDEQPARTMTVEMRNRVLQLQTRMEYDLRYLRSWKN